MDTLVIPDESAMRTRSDRVCRTANANAEGGPEGERHGRRESIQLLNRDTGSGFRVPAPVEPARAPE